MAAPWVLIPALRPGEVLVDLVARLRAAEVDVVVVDDGSGDDPLLRSRFARCGALGAVVLTHPRNLGKGQALRTGTAWVTEHAPGAGVVTADADGQHTVPDVLRVRTQVAALGPDARTLVLGVRDTSAATAPLRSRLGNRLSAVVLRLAAGIAPSDTQTGLRGLPAGLLAWAAGLGGDRYDLEYRQLLEAPRAGIALLEVPIRTVYEPGNPTSHFRPVRDSLQVMAPALAPALAFLLTGVGSFALDTLLFLTLLTWWGSVPAALLAGRVASGGVNFVLNRWWVFRGTRTPLVPSLLRYAALAAGVLVAGLVLLQALLGLGLTPGPAKLTADGVLVATSYVVQRMLVFRAGVGLRASGPSDRAPASRRPARRPAPARTSTTAAPRQRA